MFDIVMMQLYVNVTVIVGVAFIVPVNTQTVLENSLTCECFCLGYVHQCEASTYTRGEAHVSLSCDQNSFVTAENFAATCMHNEYQFGTD